MTDSNTRRWWRARIKAIMLDAIGPAKIFDMSEVDRKVEGWLDDFMETPELSLAEVAESNPNYRLAVVDTQHGIGFQEEADYFMVVKMAEE